MQSTQRLVKTHYPGKKRVADQQRTMQAGATDANPTNKRIFLGKEQARTRSASGMAPAMNWSTRAPIALMSSNEVVCAVPWNALDVLPDEYVPSCTYMDKKTSERPWHGRLHSCKRVTQEHAAEKAPRARTADTAPQQCAYPCHGNIRK